MHATRLWAVWQGLIPSFAHGFTWPGWRRFVEWVTALTLNVEEHTITQSVTALERTADWKALESFAEYERWDTDAVPRHPWSSSRRAIPPLRSIANAQARRPPTRRNPPCPW